MITKRLSDLVFDLRHPWWTFTREIALLHCQRTGQKLVAASPTGMTYNINAVDTAAAFVRAQEIQRATTLSGPRF